MNKIVICRYTRKGAFLTIGKEYETLPKEPAAPEPVIRVANDLGLIYYFPADWFYAENEKLKRSRTNPNSF